MNHHLHQQLHALINQMSDTLVTRFERSPYQTIGRLIASTIRLRGLLHLPVDRCLQIQTEEQKPPATPAVQPDPDHPAD